jgi:hypothetical protein
VVRRRRPSVHNTYAPCFRGQFVTHGGRTYLEGRFHPDLTTRVFLTIWFGTLAVWCGGVIGVTFIAVVRHPESSWRSLLLCAGFLAVGLALMTLVAWLAGPSTSIWKFEVERISTHIRQALEGRDA